VQDEVQLTETRFIAMMNNIIRDGFIVNQEYCMPWTLHWMRGLAERHQLPASPEHDQTQAVRRFGARRILLV